MVVIQAFQREGQLQKEFNETVEKWFQTGRKYLLLDSSIAWGLGNLFAEFNDPDSDHDIIGILLGMVGSLSPQVCFMPLLIISIDSMTQSKVWSKRSPMFQQSLAAGKRVFEFADQPY